MNFSISHDLAFAVLLILSGLTIMLTNIPNSVRTNIAFLIGGVFYVIGLVGMSVQL